ncbi:mitochondrial import protein Pam17 [Coniophora puteana RWD-64-598 SS2]|uniref:Presequence translocated-associated motor subunit PAM17 n=1 Tax=Coniophora puteana (strain RWD-64-598) TaxID=741705 RepID=A0A5M3N061_CONPW|nr:mitochondrial import protein Pam17 [Coniophora puteana RWD-64-598 SS2]EIW84790.1 mitochondrial import protein Pam17 [Coniophora puteana RWD-64-598 SS2]
MSLPCRTRIKPLGVPRNPSAKSTRVSRRSYTTSAPSEEAKQNLTWPEYLDIRKNKRRWETAATIPCTILGFAGGVAYFGTMEGDATKPIMGVDPLFFYGGCTVACMGLGYLVGPALGAAGWRMTHRRTMNLIEQKDRDFHKRIVKNRVDPTAQSATNPVPDFYGEKIGSLNGYRQWLRDQARFRKKARFLDE